MRRSGKSRPSSEPHRAAEPSVIVAFRRPRAFDKPAEHDAIAFGQACLERTEDADPQIRVRRPRARLVRQAPPRTVRHNPICRREVPPQPRWLRVHRVRRRVSRRRRRPRLSRHCRGETMRRELRDGARQFAERMSFLAEFFQRPEGVGEARDQVRGGGKFALGQILAWIGRMQNSVNFGCPEGCQCVRQAACTRTRPRAAQDCTLERGDGPLLAEPQQRVLEQGQERHRRSTVERRRGGEAGKNSRRRVGERVAAGIFRGNVPASLKRRARVARARDQG